MGEKWTVKKENSKPCNKLILDISVYQPKRKQNYLKYCVNHL